MSKLKSQHLVDAEKAAEQLRHAGFRLVEPEFRIPGSNARPDLVAWASSEDGQVIPWAVVEVKSADSTRHPEAVLPRLAHYANALGSIDNYVVIDSEWFKADSALRSFERVEGPSAPRHGVRGEIDDPAVIEPILNSWLAKLTSGKRGIDSAESFALPTIDGLKIDENAYRGALRRMLAGAASRTGFADHSSSAMVGPLVAQLLGNRLQGLVLDPFCGTGSFLWAVADRVRGEQGYLELSGNDVALHGVDLDARVAAIARSIAPAAGLPARIETGDAFRLELPAADVVVTAPPIGVRLQEPIELLNGQRTTDMDLAAVDLSLRQLNDGGRAVFLLPRSFVYRGAGEQYREYLANEFRVGALIGTSRNVIPRMSIAGVVLVIDKGDEPGETFVAQASDDDWEVQLGVEGPLTKAAVDHLDGFSEMWS